MTKSPRKADQSSEASKENAPNHTEERAAFLKNPLKLFLSVIFRCLINMCDGHHYTGCSLKG